LTIIKGQEAEKMNLNRLKEEILQSKGFEELLLHLAEIIKRIAQLENESV